jgi:hypothetical protein
MFVLALQVRMTAASSREMHEHERFRLAKEKSAKSLDDDLRLKIAEVHKEGASPGNGVSDNNDYKYNNPVGDTNPPSRIHYIYIYYYIIIKQCLCRHN